MGDLLSPKIRERFSRLRTRIELYRRHQGNRQNRFDGSILGLHDHQRHETERLHQKLLESRAKKAAKSSKSNKDPSSQPDQRGSSVTKKRKLESLTCGEGNNSSNVDAYTFDEPDEPANKLVRTGAGGGNGGSIGGGIADGRDANNGQLHSSVSVDIVQQISTQADPGTHQIKLTVSSTLQTGLGGGGGAKATSVSHTSTSVETSTNICKQEPADDVQCPGSSNSCQNSLPDSIGLEDVDEIKAILDTLESEEGAIPPELMRELDLGFKELEDSDSLSSTQDKADHGSLTPQPHPPHSTKSPMFTSGSNKSSPGPTMFADPLYDSPQSAPVNQNLNTMGGQGAAAMANYHRPPTGGGAAPPPPILPVGDTGPAAETLKQMAAQHQTQHQNQDGGYAMKGPLAYGADYADYARRYPPHNYPPYPGQNYPMSRTAQANMYPYNQQVPMTSHRGHMAVQPMGAKDPSLSYGGTKPLSHYPGQMGQAGPSSLQQLQNQVQSHFGQGTPGQPSQNGTGPGHLQITQTQHMQMTHGTQRMQLSQSQQMQVHNTPQISVAQQQSFTMGPQQAGQYHMNNQMKMQMMNSQQQQQQQQAAPPQAQPPQQGPPAPQPPQQQATQQPPHMQSYMNRPPPEYKVPPGGINNNYNQNNPLQTMQNMVNQTSQSGAAQNGMYAPPGGTPQPTQAGPAAQPPQVIKTEMAANPSSIPPQNIGTAAGGVSPSTSGHPANRASPLTRPNSNGMGQNSPNLRNFGPGQPGPAGIMPGQPPMGPVPNGSTASGAQKQQVPSGPHYTSALMRNQRPPNVNVGPEGLNISQQRPHAGDWPRTITPGGPGAHGGPPMGPGGQLARPGMAPGGMLAYGAYQGQGARPMGGHMNPSVAANMRMQMSQQQGVMSTGGQPAMASHMHPGGATASMMMQQQQAVQVSHPNMASMNMSQTMSTSIATSQSHQPPQQQQQQQQPQPQPQQPQHRHQPSPQQQQQQPQQQQPPQQPQQQQQQQQQPPPQQPQQQQQHQHPTSQSPHGYPPQQSSANQNTNCEFPLDFLDGAQGNGSHDFSDFVVPNSNSSDIFDELFGK